MNINQESEDLLRSALQDKAREAHDTLTLDDVRRGALQRRRHAGRRTAVLAAAAVVVAVGAPTAFLLRPTGQEPTPTPSPLPAVSTTPPAPTPSATTAPATSVLGGLDTGAAPRITFLQEHTVHVASGGTAVLPGDDAVSAFTSYHGGWLVADDDTATVRWYDNTGVVREEGKGLGQFAVSPDGTLLAFPMSGKVHVGIASGMGEGEQTVSVSDPHDVWPVGFLTDGSLVYNDAGHVQLGAPRGRTVPGPIVRARAVSSDGLIGGEDAQGRALVARASTGTVLWSSADWSVWDFSDDGRYVAATNSPTGGDFSTVAILDARTGDVVAQHPLLSDGIILDKGPVFDTDATVLFAAIDARSHERAIVRLDAAGTFTLATALLPDHPAVAGYEPLVFAAAP
jgi:hypothetical protein